jgi:hypothetical protein
MTTSKELVIKARELCRSPKFSFSRIQEISISENASCELLGEGVQELAKAAIQWRVISKLQEKAFAYDLGIEWAGIESSDEDAVGPVLSLYSYAAKTPV